MRVLTGTTAILLLALTTPVELLADESAKAEARAKNVIALLEFGGTTASIIYKAHKADQLLKTPGDKYETLARKVAAQIYQGQAASMAVKAPYDLAGAYLSTVAVLDPEPFTKTAAAIGAYGSLKLGEKLSNEIMSQAKQNAASVLSAGLAASSYTPLQLQAMSATEFLAVAEDFTVGGARLKDILADDPDSLDRIKAHAEEFHRNQQIVTLANVTSIKGTAEEIKVKVAGVTREVTKFAKETGERLNKVQTALESLKSQAEQHSKDMQDLQSAVAGNGAAIRTLAHISSMGWTTEQKISALKGGLFSDLDDVQTAAMERSLNSQLQMENQIKSLTSVATGLGYAASIATNLGLDPNIAKAAQAGQVIAAAIAQFSAGGPLGYLSGAASLSSLAGMGGGISETSALKSYLQEEFKIVNAKLDRIIDLQIETILALDNISQQLALMQKQLNTLEYMGSVNTIALTALLDESWLPCQTLLGEVNHVADISTLDELLAPLKSSSSRENLQKCYRAYESAFQSQVRRGDWGGARFGLLEFPARNDGASILPAELPAYEGSAKLISRAYLAARSFLLTKHHRFDSGDFAREPAYFLSAFLEATSSIGEMSSKMARLQTSRNELLEYKCGDNHLLSTSIGVPLCSGRAVGEKPLPGRWPQLLNASLAGPQAIRTIATGIPIATWIDFAIDPVVGEKLLFIPAESIQNAAEQPLPNKIVKKLGDNMMEWLGWLNAGYLLQYSVAFGDFTAYSIFESLFDNDQNALVRKALASDASQEDRHNAVVQSAAFLAMQSNDVLARNVVAIALQKALQREGTPQVSAYDHGVSGMRSAAGCQAAAASMEYLRALLPNWKFVYRPSQNQKETEPSLGACAALVDGQMPAGVGVLIEDQFITAPTADTLREGVLEQPPPLRIALRQRALLAEKRALRAAREWFPTSPSPADRTFARELLASQCLNNGCDVDSPATSLAP